MNGDVIIRAASHADRSALANLYLHAWRQAYAGILPARVLEGLGLYVDPPSWGRGIGRALCEHALAEMRQGGVRQVVLWVLRDCALAPTVRAVDQHMRRRVLANRRTQPGVAAG